MKFDIDFRKADGLTPDEINHSLTRNGKIWLHAGTVESPDRRAAMIAARAAAAAGRIYCPGYDRLRISPHCRFSR